MSSAKRDSFTSFMILYIENPWRCHQKTVRSKELINIFSQVIGYKIHKMQLCFYTPNNKSKRNQIKKTHLQMQLPYKLHISKRIPRNNFNQRWKIDTLKTTRYWWKKLKKTQINEKIILYSRTGRIIKCIKCLYYPNSIQLL